MIELQDVWNDKNLSKDLKARLVKALVWSALIYGTDAWTLFKSDENRIMAAEMWIWRRTLGVSWKEKRTNASILSELEGIAGKDNNSKTDLLWSHNERQWQPTHSTDCRRHGWRKKEKRQPEEIMVWQHQRVDRTELYEGQTQCTKQISVEQNNKEVCRRWSPIVKSDGSSKVAR